MLKFARLGILSLAFGFGAVAIAKEAKKADPVKAAENVVSLTAEMVDGKKTWTPTKVTAKPGKVIFRLHNKLTEAHGFDVKGVIAQPMVIQPGQTIDVPGEVKAGDYELRCQMHPAHVSSHLHVQ